MALFQGFERGAIETSGATINYVAAGDGEPVLLPQETEAIRLQRVERV